MADMIPIAEAATLVDKGTSTIRKLAQDGTIRATKNPKGLYLVERTSLLAHFARLSAAQAPDGRRTGASAQRPIPEPSASTPSTSAEMALMKARAESAEAALAIERQRYQDERRRCDELLAQNREFQGQILALTVEMQAFLTGKTSNHPSRFSSFLGKIGK